MNKLPHAKPHTAHTEHPPERRPRVLRRPEVTRRTGLGRSTLYAYMQAGRFPDSVPIGPRAVGWLDEDVDRWIADCVKEGGKS